jgi:prepilin peptidase CpaA
MFAFSAMTLLGLLLAACLADFKSRRIPNQLVLVGLAMGLVFQTVAPSGGGLFSPTQSGGLGFWASATGAAVGLAVLLPFYALRTLGAGDVKLMAMVGAWLGTPAVLMAILWTLVAGGVLALGAMVWSRNSRQVLGNLQAMVMNTLVKAQTGGGLGVDAPAQTTGRLPYAFAIASGTVFEIARHWT